MPRKINMSAEQFADKQGRRLKNSLEDIKTGVQAVTESPTEKAAAKADKMVQNLAASVQSGKWQRNLRKVSTADWQEKMITKGIPRISSGIDGARAKVVEFASQLLPYQASLQEKIDKMPDLTLDDNLNRMVEFARGMARFQRK